ncbi:kinase-like domain-containing protein, partial [Crepidotus variabilis]
MFLSTFAAASQKPSALPDDQGQIVQGYTLGPVIGYGATSIIRQATQSSSTAAVKIIRRSTLVKAGNAPLARKRLQHEASVWASLSHEHILPLFSAHHTEYADFFFTLYCPAGSLFDILKRDGRPMLEQDDAGMMFRQVVRGLRYLHTEARFVHRDIKLENIMVDEMGVCRIGDFGMAKRIGGGGVLEMGSEEDDEESFDDSFDEEEDEDVGMLHGLGHHHPQMHVQRASSFTATKRPLRSSMHPHPLSQTQSHVSNHAFHRYNTVRASRPRHSSTVSPHPSTLASLAHQPNPSLSGDNTSGSLPYAAPELLLPHTSQALRKNPHPGQDIWALGVVLYTLLAGHLPWRDAFEPRLRMKILDGTYTAPPSIGLGAERILSGCLDKNMQSRWTIERVDQVAWGVGWG